VTPDGAPVDEQTDQATDQPTSAPSSAHFPEEGQVDFDAETVDEQAAQPAGAATDADTRVAELTADLQRLQAEYVNYKRRVDRDRDLVLQNAKFSILSALLPVLDDVDRAREHEELSGGFKAVADSLERIVSGEGLVKFGARGDEFDPRLHEALMHALSPEVDRTSVDKGVQAGYQFGDRVVRPAMVTVVDPDPSGQAAAGQGDGQVGAAVPEGADEAVEDAED
jgi:molecular chaperone GrpE